MTSLDYIPIVLCADSHIVRGLHVTLFTAVKNSSVPLKITLLHRDLDQRTLSAIEATCQNARNPFTLIAHKISDASFRNFNPLVGNTFTYARLVMEDYISEPRVIYLDSDLFVALDLNRLFIEDLKGKVLGASGVGSVATALERDVFKKMGMADAIRIFNAGILLVDLCLWRSEKIKERAFEIANSLGSALLAADQTALNLLFRGDFAELDERYNVPLYATSAPPAQIEPSIYHFVGAPKPWDPFGSLLHAGFDLYSSALRFTAAPPETPLSLLDPRLCLRVLRISRSYLRCLQARLGR